MKESYSQGALKARALRRIANVLLEHAEEGRYPHSRFFDTLMPDDWIICGTSVKGDGWREHVVPCAYLARECINAFSRGETLEVVTVLLEKYLRIVKITREERTVIDFKLGYRSTMPPNWVFGEGDPYQRLIDADIVFDRVHP